jgi:hypothetical protein
MAKKMTAEQTLSRIQNILRGMVSPKYVKEEAASRKKNVKRGMMGGGKVMPKKKMMHGGKVKKK